MSYAFTVKAVQPNPREWGNVHGRYKDFTVTIEAESGNTRDVSWSRKIREDGTFPSPQVGDKIEADLEVKVNPRTGEPIPPGWKISNVKFGDGGPSRSSTGSSNGYQQRDQSEFRRSKEEMTVQAADTAAIAAVGQHPQWNPAGDSNYLASVEAMSAWLQLRWAGVDSKPEPAPQAFPENRKDIERTGESDVPAPQQQEFVHASSGVDTDEVPF